MQQLNSGQEGTKQEETNTDSGAVIVHRLDEIKSISIYLQQLHKGVSMKHPGGHLPIIRLSGPVAEVVKATQDSAWAFSVQSLAFLFCLTFTGRWRK